jgi:hypothetical protein
MTVVQNKQARFYHETLKDLHQQEKNLVRTNALAYSLGVLVTKEKSLIRLVLFGMIDCCQQGSLVEGEGLVLLTSLN